MTLSERILAASLAVIGVLVASILLIAGRRLDDRLARDTEASLGREAGVIGIAWQNHPGNPDSMANAAGVLLHRRVTLIDSTGVVLGDSEFDGEALHHLQNHSTRPEVIQARASGVGASVRSSASAGDEEMYVAVRIARGFVRVSLRTSQFREIVSGAQRDVLIASLIALLVAVVMATLFSRRVSRPIAELRDVTRAIAAGDLTRRAPLDAPGEVGDLAVSIHRMAEELGNRLAAMTAEDALLLAIIEALDEGIIAVDRSGNVMRMNDAARRLFGSRSALPFGIDELSADHGALRSLLSAESDPASEIETTIGDRIVALSSRPLPAGGTVIAALDLTERRRLETVRRDFVANVSHELKTPLTVLAGYAETLGDPQLAAADRERFVSTIVANANRMQRIVDDLLDLSRYESGSWVPRPTDVDLAEAIAEQVAPIASEAARRGISIDTDIAPDARSIRVDPTALRQILSNLLENAMRYTAAGGIVVRAARAPDGLHISVEDTGVGIEAEHLSRIFERFYRVDSGRSRAAGGTGLGLAIVRHLVEAHGGRIWAESEVGAGTRIRIVFPGG